MSKINDFNVADLRNYIEGVKKDSTKADRHPKLIAKWEGGAEARIEFGDIITHIGGEGQMSAMNMVLASLAACDVEVLAMHASLLGLKIENLSIEASGHFNVGMLLDLEDAPSPGYQSISYTVRIDAPEATPEQMSFLRERCERSSPVGDTLTRTIPLKLEFEAGP
ncbi:MAG: OsmC family protein [Candidatus Heimdallarchaeota archaeon]